MSRSLSDLLEINRTATLGYQKAAEEVTNPTLRTELSRLSQQRAQFATELEQKARQWGVDTHTGTVEGALTDAAAALHRGWLQVKGTVTGHNDSAILGECETGDATALEAYETALRSSELPVEARSVIQKQHGDILTAKNWIAQQKGKNG